LYRVVNEIPWRSDDGYKRIYTLLIGVSTKT
jgi:hypothetical protein